MSGYMLFEVVTFLLAFIAFISECHKLSHYNECLHHIAVHRWLVLRISTLNTIRRLSHYTHNFENINTYGCTCVCPAKGQVKGAHISEQRKLNP